MDSKYLYFVAGAAFGYFVLGAIISMALGALGSGA